MMLCIRVSVALVRGVILVRSKFLWSLSHHSSKIRSHHGDARRSAAITDVGIEAIMIRNVTGAASPEGEEVKTNKKQ